MKKYRCGWCGCPTNEYGDPLNPAVLDNWNESELHDAILTNGDCCRAEQEGQLRMRVTRDMAIDAGDPSLEGEWI